MPTAADKFKEQLTTAFLEARPRANTGLSRADQRDAIQIAVEWCLVHQSQYQPDKQTVAQWFGARLANVLLSMRRDQQRQSVRRAIASMEELERNRTVTPSRRSELHYSVRWSKIDHEIEQLLRRPKHERADCPSCWRCRWYDGLTPVAWAPPSHANSDVRLAVEAIERRKIKIAGGDPDDYT
jgi:hypothetical protein